MAVEHWRFENKATYLLAHHHDEKVNLHYKATWVVLYEGMQAILESDCEGILSSINFDFQTDSYIKLSNLVISIEDEHGERSHMICRNLSAKMKTYTMRIKQFKKPSSTWKFNCIAGKFYVCTNYLHHDFKCKLLFA